MKRFFSSPSFNAELDKLMKGYTVRELKAHHISENTIKRI